MLAVVLAANIMDLMDATIVNVAGPSIRAALGGSASTLQWLPAGYTLAFAVFLITGARLGDMFGRRRLFLVGSAGFTLMSAACAVAPSMAVLITFRVVQGSFGALMIPQGFGMLKEVFAEDEMPKVFGLFGPMMGLSVLAAPILAGALIEANLWGIGWRLVFLINVPIGIVALAGAVRVLPRTVAHPGIRLDTGGMALIGIALTAIIYPLIQGRTAGWPAWTIVMMGACALLLGAFVLWERRHRGDPLIEPGLLANRAYTRGGPATLERARRGGAGYDLLLGPRPPSANTRADDHRLGVPGAPRHHLPARVQAADARPRATDLTRSSRCYALWAPIAKAAATFARFRSARGVTGDATGRPGLRRRQGSSQKPIDDCDRSYVERADRRSVRRRAVPQSSHSSAPSERRDCHVIAISEWRLGCARRSHA